MICKGKYILYVYIFKLNDETHLNVGISFTKRQTSAHPKREEVERAVCCKRPAHWHQF